MLLLQQLQTFGSCATNCIKPGLTHILPVQDCGSVFKTVLVTSLIKNLWPSTFSPAAFLNIHTNLFSQ